MLQICANLHKYWNNATLQSRTGPVQGLNTEQGFPCEVFLTGKTLFSLQGNPVLIAGTLFSLQGMGLQCMSNDGSSFEVD